LSAADEFHSFWNFLEYAIVSISVVALAQHREKEHNDKECCLRKQEEAAVYHQQAPDWELLDQAKRIERTYRFKNFGGAFKFVERAGALAEAEAHHPDISFGWGYATVSLRTKKIQGLHENDFIMATKLDRIAAEGAS
jgi:4a-hydroxytetrahydrobiopterin dehydratase